MNTLGYEVRVYVCVLVVAFDAPHRLGFLCCSNRENCGMEATLVDAANLLTLRLCEKSQGYHSVHNGDAEGSEGAYPAGRLARCRQVTRATFNHIALYNESRQLPRTLQAP